MTWTLAQLADAVNGTVHGNPEHPINSVATLANAKQEDISFLANQKYKKYLATTQAGAVLVSPELVSFVPGNAIEVRDPYVAYAKVAAYMFPPEKAEAEVHPSAWVDPGATVAKNVTIGAQVFIDAGVTIGEDVVIGPGCVIQSDVSIGSGTRLEANVTLCRGVNIGYRVLIHPGVVIGADGFGIANDQGHWIKVPQLGAVDIGDDVEIGANTTIDRGAIENTRISNGVKLDNQIQIGHNVTIGEHTVIAGCVGIAGSTHIGANCAIGGGTGIGGHITIADGVQLTGMSMVTKSIPQAGVYSSGIPVEATKDWHRNIVRYRQMDKLHERVKYLETLIKE